MKNGIVKFALSLSLLIAACDVPPDKGNVLNPGTPGSHHGVIGLDDNTDVATIKQGLHCGLDLPPFGCWAWIPDPIPGFVMVASNYLPANNEFMMCDSSGSYCQKCAMNAGGFYNIANLGDWYAGGQFYIKTIRSQMHRDQTIYSGTSFTGSSWGWTGAITLTNVPATAFKPNSMAIAN